MRQKKSAVEIADTAQAFGQEDDTTVLSVMRLATAEPAIVAPLGFAVGEA